MRTRILVVAAVVVVSAVAPVLAADGLTLLPENTAGVLTISNIERLYSKLGIDELRAERPDEFRMISEELMEYVGVDLLDPAAMKAKGFQVDRPFHIGILSDPPAVAVLIPGKGQARDWIRARLELLGVHFTLEARHGGIEVDGGEADEVACFEHKGYVGIVVTDHGDGGGSAMETARKLIETDRAVTASQSFERTMARLPSGSDATFYIGPDFRSRMSTWGTSKEELSQYGVTGDEMASWERDLGLADIASALAMRVEPDRFTVDGFSWLPADSPARRWMVVDNDPVSFLHRIPSKPWLAIVSRLDVAALWDVLAPILDRTTAPDDGSAREVFDAVKAETGLDLETDVIGQLRGNLGALVSQVAFVGTDLVLFAQVREPARFQDTLNRVTALVEEDIEKKARENPEAGQQAQVREDELGGVRVHCIAFNPSMEVCYGMVDDHVVFASLPQRFAQVATGGEGFVNAISNDAVRQALVDPKGSVFYIDIRALARDAQQILPMLGPNGVAISQVLSELSELAVVSRVDDEGVVQKTTLSSTRPGVWKYLLGLLASEAAKLQTD